MRRTEFTEEQIALAIHRVEDGGVTVVEACCKLGISDATFYKWKKRYGSLLPSEIRRLRQVEEEDKRLKALVADLSLDKHMLQNVLAKKF